MTSMSIAEKAIIAQMCTETMQAIFWCEAVYPKNMPACHGYSLVFSSLELHIQCRCIIPLHFTIKCCLNSKKYPVKCVPCIDFEQNISYM